MSNSSNNNEFASINDRDNDRPIIVKRQEDISNTILPLIVLIVLIIFIGWMLYLLVSSGFTSVIRTTRQGLTGSTGAVLLSCNAGQCATDLYTGFKICPEKEDDIVQINPGYQVCNSRYICDNPLTPYAVQSDGSTNIYGICEHKTECPCVNNFRCARYIQSAFTTNGGNPYQSVTSQRMSFPQTNTFVGSNNVISTDPPIQFSDPSTTFCTASLQWLTFANPGCGFTGTLDAQTLTVCMGLPLACNGVTGNPCLQGTLAIISNNLERVTTQNLNSLQYGCVSGLPCPCGQVAIYDTNYNGIICRSIVD